VFATDNDFLSQEPKEPMNQVAFRGTLIVLAHMVVLVGHGAAHSHLQIEPSPWQHAFIAVVILATPVLAALLLWRRGQRIGMTLLAMSLGGSLLFGLYFHFIAAGIDSAFNPILRIGTSGLGLLRYC
jgi:hypothetical protein